MNFENQAIVVQIVGLDSSVVFYYKIFEDFSQFHIWNAMEYLHNMLGTYC